MANSLMTLAVAAILVSTGTSAAAQKTANAPAPALQYCITYEPMTGSRIGRTECKTKAEWTELGVDVDKLLKKKR